MSSKTRKPPKDGLGAEIDPEALYYLQDTRQKVGNCMMFWCPNGGGYTCQLDEAGEYTGAEALDRVRSGDTEKAWPVRFIERAAVRHVRADSIDVRVAAAKEIGAKALADMTADGGPVELCSDDGTIRGLG